MDHVRWENYYAAIEGRAPRALFLDAIALAPRADSDDRALVAIDLGCGDGTETRELLARGWIVVAIDQTPKAIKQLVESVPAREGARLTGITGSFSDVDLPPADLVYAGLALPFCDPERFRTLWPRITSAIRDDGWFAGHFFGPRDSWAGNSGMTFLPEEEVRALLLRMRIEVFREQDEDGEAVGGSKHWHVFHVIAQKIGPAA